VVRRALAGVERITEGCPERFEFAIYRWIWNYTRDSQPRIDAPISRTVTSA
jgi:hypothetical protein